MDPTLVDTVQEGVRSSRLGRPERLSRIRNSRTFGRVAAFLFIACLVAGYAFFAVGSWAIPYASSRVLRLPVTGATTVHGDAHGWYRPSGVATSPLTYSDFSLNETTSFADAEKHAVAMTTETRLNLATSDASTDGLEVLGGVENRWLQRNSAWPVSREKSDRTFLYTYQGNASEGPFAPETHMDLTMQDGVAVVLPFPSGKRSYEYYDPALSAATEMTFAEEYPADMFLNEELLPASSADTADTVRDVAQTFAAMPGDDLLYMYTQTIPATRIGDGLYYAAQRTILVHPLTGRRVNEHTTFVYMYDEHDHQEESEAEGLPDEETLLSDGSSVKSVADAAFAAVNDPESAPPSAVLLVADVQWDSASQARAWSRVLDLVRAHHHVSLVGRPLSILSTLCFVVCAVWAVRKI